MNSPLVIIPTYNEAENIVQICERTLAALPHAHLLVVDDNSPDGTADLAEAMGEERIFVLRRAEKAGLGPAYIAGFRWGIARGFEFLVEMDADGSHPPESLPRLIGAQADVVIGSRYVDGGEVRDWTRRRVLLSRMGNRYVRWMLRLPAADATAGYRVYTSAALETIDLDAIRATGYGFQIDMTRRAAQAGLRIVEVPITFTDRLRGQSKMSGSIVAEALLLTTWWGITDRLRYALRRSSPRRTARRSSRSN